MSQREVSRRRAPTVEIDVGTAYEFILSLTIFNDKFDFDKEFEYEVGVDWFNTIKKKASPVLLQNIEHFTLNAQSPRDWCHGWSHLLGLVYDCPAPKDATTFLAYLEAIEPLEILLHLLGYYQRDFRNLLPLDAILQTAMGDQDALAHYIHATYPDDALWQEKLHTLLSEKPETTKTLLLTTLQQWYEEIFCDQEAYIASIIERDAEAKRAMRQTMPSDRLIETATNGLVFTPIPGLRKVVLIPSFLTRPWNETSDYQELRFQCYPVADEFVSRNGAPPQLLIRAYKALADERRLRILKLLMARPYSLQELADEFGVAKSTLHHHLAILRAGGLVIMGGIDGKFYRLRKDKLTKVTELLDMYLQGPPSS